MGTMPEIFSPTSQKLWMLPVVCKQTEKPVSYNQSPKGKKPQIDEQCTGLSRQVEMLQPLSYWVLHFSLLVINYSRAGNEQVHE